jgi:hypothetical protein
MERIIRYRGSITDLATDIAFEITPEKALELIRELHTFIEKKPEKFQNAAHSEE